MFRVRMGILTEKHAEDTHDNSHEDVKYQGYPGSESVVANT